MGDSGNPELVYLNVYLNGASVSAKDIDEVEPALVGELSSAQLEMLNINLETVSQGSEHQGL